MQVLSRSSIPELLEELKLLRVNVLLLNGEVAAAIAAKDDRFAYTVIADFKDDKAVVLPKHSRLTVRFNKAIDDLERTGQLKELSNKWIVNSSVLSQ